MSLLTPVAPPYDPVAWAAAPWPVRARQVCEAWALQGYGSPPAVYAVYAVKVLLYIGGWLLFCRFTPGMGGLGDIGDWWLRPEAFEKAILWSLLFEGLGLGCGSGPLTGRYLPPVGGFLYFLRPGTTKLPLFPRLPLLGGVRRGPLDVILYAAVIGSAVRALVAAEPGTAVLVPLAVLIPLLGIADRTCFLAFRSEHYWTAILILALAADWTPGLKGLWAGLWLWAGVSKLNHHFPAVVGVMTSNSAIVRPGRLRRLMYRRFPDDLNPSRLAVGSSYVGTLLEFSTPIVLLAGDGGPVTVAGLVIMLALHSYITFNVPMGVPLEWNVMMVYGGFFLFWKHAHASLTDMTWPVAAVLLVMTVSIPLLGNLVPSRVPFLMAMRYYAGNWAYSVWLFRGDSHKRLERLTTSSPWVYDQLARLYPHDVAVGVVGKVMGFRLMHLHGRALASLVPKAIDIERLGDYEWVDGEIVAGLVLGWNFGDGHLHREELLHAVQAQCGFEPGELRCIMVESQPIHDLRLHWRIHDAATGPIAAGHVAIADLRAQQPWGPPIAATETDPTASPRP